MSELPAASSNRESEAHSCFFGESHHPVLLLLVAGLCIFYGTAALTQTVAALFSDKLLLDPVILALPLGRELLKGDSGSRRLGIVVSGALFFLIIAITGLQIFAVMFRSTTPEKDWLAVVDRTLHLATLATVFFGLRSAQVRKWFNVGPKDDTALRWTLPLMALGMLFGASTILQARHARVAAEGIFPFATEFAFEDARTGKAIATPISLPVIMLSSPGATSQLQPKITRTSLGSDRTWQVLGLSNQPFELLFKANGYHPYTFSMDRKTPNTVRLKLQPLAE